MVFKLKSAGPKYILMFIMILLSLKHHIDLFWQNLIERKAKWYFEYSKNTLILNQCINYKLGSKVSPSVILKATICPLYNHMSVCMSSLPFAV